MDTPYGLLNALFFYVGIDFGLRGGTELYNFSRYNLQVVLWNNIKYLVYTESFSKTNAECIAQRKLNLKRVKVEENTCAGDRCVVGLLLKYQAMCDHEVKFLFCQPIARLKGRKWFWKQKLGIY